MKLLLDSIDRPREMLVATTIIALMTVVIGSSRQELPTSVADLENKESSRAEQSEDGIPAGELFAIIEAIEPIPQISYWDCTTESPLALGHGRLVGHFERGPPFV